MASRYSKQVSLGFDSEGRRVRKWIHSDSKQELLRKEKELLRNSGTEILSSKKFGPYRSEWYEAYKKNLSLSMQEQYTYACGCLSALDEKQLKSITRTDVQKILNEYADRPASARLIAMTAKQILDSAAADGLISPRLWKFALPDRQNARKRPLTAATRQRGFTPAEKKAIQNADLDPRERLFVDLELYLGLRPEETRALTPHDFDLDARTVTISKAAAAHGSGILKETKTGAVRTLPLPDVLVAEIRAYNAHFRGFYYFTDEEGDLWSRGDYQCFSARIFKKINVALGGNSKINLLNGMTMYTFRHNRATEIYYLPGVSMKKKAEYMGHSELVFLKTYSHLDNDQEAVELLRGGAPDPSLAAVTNL